MPLFEMTSTTFRPVPEASFASMGIGERSDIQRLLRTQIAVLGDDLKVPESKEEGRRLKKQPTFPVRGVTYYEGVPLVGATVTFEADASVKGARGSAEGRTEADGTFRLSTYTAFDGCEIQAFLHRPAAASAARGRDSGLSCGR